MRRGLVIGGALLGVIAATLLIWRPRDVTPEQWMRSAARQLRQMPPPPTSLAASLGDGEWAGGGYLLFAHGWACFTSHDFHASEHDGDQIGDVGLLRASDGSLYVSHFHFCVGLNEYLQLGRPPEEKQPRPRDLAHFLALYGKTHGWEKIPDV